MRDRRGHLAHGSQPIPQPLTLFELLDAREILEEHRRADDAARVVADERQRIAEDLSRRAQPQFGAVRQQVQLERAAEKAHDFGMVAQNVGDRPPEIGPARRDPENAVRLVVDEREKALAGQREDTVPHACHDVPEERVVHIAGLSRYRRGDWSPGPWARPSGRRRPAYRAATRLGHQGVVHGAWSSWPRWQGPYPVGATQDPLKRLTTGRLQVLEWDTTITFM